MQLLIMQLPKEVTGDDTILRHFMVFTDGAIWYQDELLQKDGPIVESRRTDWTRMPSPPVVPPVVGIIDFGGMPLAMRADGSSWIWGKMADEPAGIERWTPFLSPVPTPEMM